MMYTRSLPLVALGLLACRPPMTLSPWPDTGDTARGDTDTTRDTDTGNDTGDTGNEQIGDGPVVYAGAELFDEESIPEFALELSAESMAALRSSPYDWVSGTFTYDGEVFENVGVRTKGSSSWRGIDDKPALKVKFDKYVDDQRFLDLSELTLNNMVGDYSMMHERVAYLFYREAGVPARRAHHAHLTLNGQDYGLYVHTESSTRKMIEPWFDDSGSLWEFSDSELDDTYVEGMQLEFGEEDKSKLYEATSLLQGTGAIDMDAVESAIDMEAFQRYWAVSIVVTQYDGYPYRYPADDAYVYHDPESDQLKFMPHGVDEAFYYPDTDPSSPSSRLGWKCSATPGCYERMVELAYESLDLIEAMDPDPLTYFDQVREQIDPYVQSDPKKEYGYASVVAYQNSMRDVIENRRAQLERLTAQ